MVGECGKCARRAAQPIRFERRGFCLRCRYECVVAPDGVAKIHELNRASLAPALARAAIGASGLANAGNRGGQIDVVATRPWVALQSFNGGRYLVSHACMSHWIRPLKSNSRHMRREHRDTYFHSYYRSQSV